MMNVLNCSRINLVKMMKKEITAVSENVPSRRIFLKGFACVAATAMMGTPGMAQAAKGSFYSSRKLALHNLHTEEKLALTYFDRGRYVSSAVHDLSYLLRDHRSGDSHAMDPELFDLLDDLQASLGGNKTFQVISGYRSPATNHMLNKTSSGVAKKSYHMQGKAIDIRVVGVDSRKVQKAAIELARGGVGYYRRSDFVHIDTGNIRHW